MDDGWDRFVVLDREDPQLLERTRRKQKETHRSTFADFRSGCAAISIFQAEGSNAANSFVMRSPIPWNMVVTFAHTS